MNSQDCFVKLNINTFVYPKQQFMPTVHYNFYDKFIYYDINNPVIYAELEAFVIQYAKPTRIDYVELFDVANLPLHKDHGGIQCAINFYYEAHGADTVFYKCNDESLAYGFKPEGTEVTKHHGENVLYNREDCTEIGRFTAQTGTAYLLNNQAIHSVESKQALPRRFIQYEFHHNDFNEIRLAFSKVTI